MQRGQLKKSKQFQQESKQNRSSIWSTDSSRTEWIRYTPRMKGMLLNPPRCFAGNLDAAAAAQASFFSPLASSAMALVSPLASVQRRSRLRPVESYMRPVDMVQAPAASAGTSTSSLPSLVMGVRIGDGYALYARFYKGIGLRLDWNWMDVRGKAAVWEQDVLTVLQGSATVFLKFLL